MCKTIDPARRRLRQGHDRAAECHDSVCVEPASTELQLRVARRLFDDYLLWAVERFRADDGLAINVQPYRQIGAAEMKQFRPPFGRLYLVTVGGRPAGVGCLRRLPDGVAEIKRLYVSRVFRGMHLGAAILDQLLEDARAIGYRRVKLETAQFMRSAAHLYRRRGFEATAPYPGRESLSDIQPFMTCMERVL